MERMEEIRAIASAHYKNGSGQMKQMANKFFLSMDANGDGKISLAEYLAFLKKQQDVDQRMCSRHFFNSLKKDKSKDHMSHADVLTLYYIILSERRFCGACGNFLCGLYFTCVECFPLQKNRYSVCFECYRYKIFVHDHSGPLVDNYALPIVMNAINLDKKRTTKTSSSSSRAIVPVPSSTAMVPVPSSGGRGSASKIAKLVLTIAELLAAVGGAAAICSIM